jgi:hypothetical protein
MKAFHKTFEPTDDVEILAERLTSEPGEFPHFDDAWDTAADEDLASKIKHGQDAGTSDGK